MESQYLHPQEEIIEVINRIYHKGMTTTSGGNLSIRGADGSLWITPKGIDKGTLTVDDIVRVLPDGTAEGRHEPSSEYPFHLAVYKARPDITAVVHAHPPALVAFAITRKIPDTRIIPKALEMCGTVGYANYALPGSEALGGVIAESFAAGHDTVLLENHGIVTIGATLMQAFHKLETLDLCARLTLKANAIGTVHILTNSELELARQTSAFAEFEPNGHTARENEKEQEIRKQMIGFVRRSYAQNLVTSMEGTFSARVDGESFLITPYGMDRKYLAEEDLVLIWKGRSEAGKLPSRSTALHREIYAKHSGVAAIMIAQPPNILAFGVCDAEFDSRTIPESYIVLRDIPKLPYGMEFGKGGTDAPSIADIISDKVPVVLCRNNCIIVTGSSLLQCYDRLEVAEFSAKAVIASKSIGRVVPIGAAEIGELEKAFNL
jgi:L-fuculose-phosphate aldolase